MSLRAADVDSRKGEPAARAEAEAELAPSWDRLLRASGLPRHEARALLEHASARGRSWLVAHGDEPAEPASAARF
ncbi:MAG TPA: hypothetical protein PK177_17460, partial [Burkholderiaceae bacterium]|nr:hypothetical protein [Burkholderiaceae bacterium]